MGTCKIAGYPFDLKINSLGRESSPAPKAVEREKAPRGAGDTPSPRGAFLARPGGRVRYVEVGGTQAGSNASTASVVVGGSSSFRSKTASQTASRQATNALASAAHCGTVLVT